MENPNTWTMAHNVVQLAIQTDLEDNAAGIIGQSLAGRIVDYLTRYGYLTHDALEVTGLKELPRPF